jgi:N4-gp56 family major capsid protein
MAIDNFIPQVWAGTMMRYLDRRMVALNLVNRDYEGDISGAGDSVKVNQIGPITVSDYTKNTNISAAQDLTGDGAMLIIDQQKYFNFQVDDVDAAQSKPKVMQTAMQRAAYAISNTVDTDIFTVISAAVPSGNTLTADTSMSSTDAYDHIVELGVKLDENDVPEDGRWCVVAPWYYGLLLKDARFIIATPRGDTTLRTGEVGEIDNMTVYKSNNLVQPSAGATYDTLAGASLATTFANALVELNAYRPELRFADAVKGLHVYGRKVLLPNALAKIVCTK